MYTSMHTVYHPNHLFYDYLDTFSDVVAQHVEVLRYWTQRLGFLDILWMVYPLYPKVHSIGMKHSNDAPPYPYISLYLAEESDRMSGDMQRR